MATELERLVVTLEASTKQYERALAKAQSTTVSAMRKVERAQQESARRQAAIFNRMGEGIKQGLLAPLRGIGPAIIASIGVSSIIDAVGGAIKAVAALGDQAADLGMPVAELQTWNKLALESGQSSEMMAKALSEIAEQSGDTESALSKLFSANNVQMSADATKNMQAFMDILQRAKSPAEQLGIAADVLGKKLSRGMLEALKEGPDAFIAKYAEMNAAGEHFSEEEVRRIREIETQWNSLMASLATSFQSFVVSGVLGWQQFAREASAAMDKVKNDAGWFSSTAAGKIWNWATGAPGQPPAAPLSTRPGAGHSITGGNTAPGNESTRGLVVETAAKKEATAATEDLVSKLQDEVDARQKNITMSAQEIDVALDNINAKKEEADALAAAQREQERVTELNNIARDAVQGFTQDLIDGASAADAFRDMLKRLADQLVDMAFQQLFAAGGAKGGLLGALMGTGTGTTALPANAAGGTYRVGGSSAEHPVAISAQRGEMITVTPRRLQGRGGGGPASISTGNTVIHINGAADDRVVAMMDRRIQENNVRQRQVLQREWGGMSMQYSRLRGP